MWAVALAPGSSSKLPAGSITLLNFSITLGVGLPQRVQKSWVKNSASGTL